MDKTETKDADKGRLREKIVALLATFPSDATFKKLSSDAEQVKKELERWLNTDLLDAAPAARTAADSQRDREEFIKAAEDGDLPTVISKLEQGKVTVEVRSGYGRTALHRAVGRGQLEIVKYLLETANANANMLDSTGDTPLHSAAYYSNNKPIVQLLLEKGGDPLLPGSNGYTTLHYLVKAVVDKFKTEEQAVEILPEFVVKPEQFHETANGVTAEDLARDCNLPVLRSALRMCVRFARMRAEIKSVKVQRNRLLEEHKSPVAQPPEPPTPDTSMTSEVLCASIQSASREVCMAFVGALSIDYPRDPTLDAITADSVYNPLISTFLLAQYKLRVTKWIHSVGGEVLPFIVARFKQAVRTETMETRFEIV